MNQENIAPEISEEEQQQLVSRIRAALPKMCAEMLPEDFTEKLPCVADWDRLSDELRAANGQKTLSADSIPLFSTPKKEAPHVCFGWSEYTEEGEPTTRAIPMVFGVKHHEESLSSREPDEDNSGFVMIYSIPVLAKRGHWNQWLSLYNN